MASDKLNVKCRYDKEIRRFSLSQKTLNFKQLVDKICATFRLTSSDFRGTYGVFFEDDEGDYCRIDDAKTLQEAIRLSYPLLRIKVTPQKDRSVRLASSVSEAVRDAIKTSLTAILRIISSSSNGAERELRNLLDSLERRSNNTTREKIISARRSGSLAHDISKLRARSRELLSELDRFLVNTISLDHGQIRHIAFDTWLSRLSGVLARSQISELSRRKVLDVVAHVLNDEKACVVLWKRRVILEATGNTRRHSNESLGRIKHDATRPRESVVETLASLLECGNENVQYVYESMALSIGANFDKEKILSVVSSLSHTIRDFVVHDMYLSSAPLDQEAVHRLIGHTQVILFEAGVSHETSDWVSRLLQAMSVDSNIIDGLLCWKKTL